MKNQCFQLFSRSFAKWKIFNQAQVAPQAIKNSPKSGLTCLYDVRLLKDYKDALINALDASNWTLTQMVGECFFDVPLLILRSGVLRQGSANFYSLSFQARHSFFVTFDSL